jgi:hypothetical protein
MNWNRKRSSCSRWAPPRNSCFVTRRRVVALATALLSSALDNLISFEKQLCFHLALSAGQAIHVVAPQNSQLTAAALCPTNPATRPTFEVQPGPASKVALLGQSLIHRFRYLFIVSGKHIWTLEASSEASIRKESLPDARFRKLLQNHLRQAGSEWGLSCTCWDRVVLLSSNRKHPR